MDRDQSKHCHHNNHSQSRVSLEFTEPQWNHTTDSCRARRLCQEHEEKLQATLAESVYPSMPSNIFVDTKTRSLHCFWQEPFHPGGCWQGTGFPAIESNHNVFIFEITGLLPLSTKIMWWEGRGGGVKAFIWSEPNNEILFCCVYKRVMGQKENKHGKVSDPLYSVRTVILCQVTWRHWPN